MPNSKPQRGRRQSNVTSQLPQPIKPHSLWFVLTSGKSKTHTLLCVFMKSWRSTKWDLEVICSPSSSEAVLKLPLAHPVGLPEKCTYRITDQLTLSAVLHNDWHCTPIKLQTFNQCWQDKVWPSLPHTSFSTSLSLETSSVFHVVIKCSRYLWTLMDKPFIPRWALDWKTEALPSNKSKHGPRSKQPFWFEDNRNLTCLSPPTSEKTL